MNQSIRDIMAERAVQVSKGYDAKHDDQHTDQSIALCAALVSDPFRNWNDYEGSSWPQEAAAHISKKYRGDRRRQLVIAAALLVAEIERIDRIGGER